MGPECVFVLLGGEGGGLVVFGVRRMTVGVRRKWWGRLPLFFGTEGTRDVELKGSGVEMWSCMGGVSRADASKLHSS